MKRWLLPTIAALAIAAAMAAAYRLGAARERAERLRDEARARHEMDELRAESEARLLMLSRMLGAAEAEAAQSARALVDATAARQAAQQRQQQRRRTPTPGGVAPSVEALSAALMDRERDVGLRR